MNPLVRKLSKVTETSDISATYAGISGKCLFFIAMVLAGVALQMILNSIAPITGTLDGNDITVSATATIAAFVALGIFLITPFIAFLIRPTIPVTGTLYCVSTGYLLTFFATILVDARSIMLIALALTIAVVTVMALLYSSGKIKVTQKFRTVVTTLLLASVAGALIFFICSLIPGLRDVVTFFQNNRILKIACAVGGVVIATLFLLVDFDTVQKAVEKRLPKKYEWIAAFALVFSVIWLYFKILDLLSQAKGQN